MKTSKHLRSSSLVKHNTLWLLLLSLFRPNDWEVGSISAESESISAGPLVGNRGAGAGGARGQLPPPQFLSQWDGYACAPLNFANHQAYQHPPPQKKEKNRSRAPGWEWYQERNMRTESQAAQRPACSQVGQVYLGHSCRATPNNMTWLKNKQNETMTEHRRTIIYHLRTHKFKSFFVNISLIFSGLRLPALLKCRPAKEHLPNEQCFRRLPLGGAEGLNLSVAATINFVPFSPLHFALYWYLKRSP